MGAAHVVSESITGVVNGFLTGTTDKLLTKD